MCPKPGISVATRQLPGFQRISTAYLFIKELEAELQNEPPPSQTARVCLGIATLSVFLSDSP